MRILLTGAAGFIGSHFVEQILERTDHEIVSIERLDTSGYYGRLSNLPIWDSQKHRFKSVFHDLKAPFNDYVTDEIGEIDLIFHVAAASHVDRSIEDPMSFILDNVAGTANVLDFARGFLDSPPFFYFSTDEVYGPAAPGILHKETDRHKPANPYAASKSGAEALVVAYGNTYKVPYIITNTMNVFGPRQHPEKFIPSTIRKILNDEKVIIHADSTRTKPGSRFYIHAAKIVDAYLFLLDKWENSGVYNIVGEQEIDNLTLAEMIAKFLGKFLDYELVDFHSSRPGHDLRYALSGEKLASMGWMPPGTFQQDLEETVKWYVDNPKWLMA